MSTLLSLDYLNVTIVRLILFCNTFNAEASSGAFQHVLSKPKSIYDLQNRLVADTNSLEQIYAHGETSMQHRFAPSPQGRRCPKDG
jgi:hypothetical protein